MTDEEAIRTTRAHIESQFPRACSCCHKQFASLAEYLFETRHVGPPVSYDAEAGDWLPRAPIGTLSMANCTCGTTLTIDAGGMGLWTLWRLMLWARRETRRRGLSMRELLTWMRAQIDEQVLRECSCAPQASVEIYP